jgi:hypothetical protein
LTDMKTWRLWGVNTVSATHSQLALFEIEKVPYACCPNCYTIGGIGPRSDIDAFHCWNCDTIVDADRWE